MLILRMILVFCLAAAAIRFSPERRLSAADQETSYQDELPRIAPVPLADALQTLKVEAGFRLELAAHEPQVTDPVAMAFDEHGRLFVVEMRGYSERGEQQLGAVRLLTDTDGDGTYDESTTYVDQLSWPTAICCFDGGIFVGAAPDMLYCKDTDGDGRADLRRAVFTGFGKSNVQGLFNSFQWSLDNRIHGATSSSSAQLRRPHEPDSLGVSLRGRDFSFDPATLAWRPESGGGQHGMSFDRWGRKFNCTNSDHMRAVIVPDRYLARNPYYALPNAAESIAVDGPQAEVYRQSPVEPWRTVRTRLRVAGEVRGPVEGGGRASGYFTSATGVTIYDGDAWPSEYRRHTYALVGDVGSNIIHRKRVVSKGVSFSADRVDPEREFVAATDIWFRPVQFCHGPDGALYVADFHREVIEHPASLPPMIKRHLDLNSGNDRGRIYRIVPEGYTYTQRLLPGDASPTERVAMLEHPNSWHRLTAARLLYEQQDRGLAGALEQLVLKSDQPVARIHALWLLAGIDALDPAVLLSALEDEHPRVREQAIIAAEQFAGDSNTVREQLLGMIDDSDVRVRFQLALSLGEFSWPETAAALADLLRSSGHDAWLRGAVLSSSAQLAGQLREDLKTTQGWASSKEGQSILAELAKIEQRRQRDEDSPESSSSRRIAMTASSTPLKHEAKKDDVIERYRLALGEQASAARGAKIFQKTCASCHDVDRDEGGIAPSVASYRTKGEEFILVNVIDPNREVNPQYLSYTVQTVNGLTTAGIITGETATSLTLAAGRDAKKTILHLDIEAISSTGKSLMPENLEKEIDQQQMADLIAFLTQQP